MKPMKVETCRECGAKREVPITCWDCESWDVGPYPRCLCGKSGKRLCKEFRPLPEVENLLLNAAGQGAAKPYPAPACSQIGGEP